MAAWLALGRPAHILAVALIGTAALALWLAAAITAAQWAWAAVLLAGAGETWFALRVAFDQSVFATWACSWRHPAANPAEDMAHFDATLKRPHAGLQRNLDSRMSGARRLLQWQLACLLLQILALAAALILRIGHVA